MLLSQLLRAPVGSRLLRSDINGDTLTLEIATTTSHSNCPSCHQESWRIHGRYSRTLAEEPILGNQVRLKIAVRRFVCPNAECPRRVFAEPLEGFATRYARTTCRLARSQRAIGSALGGLAGARLAKTLAIPTSADTLLRRVKRLEARALQPRRVVGIDDWAWSKGQRYGTIVVDLETGEVIDLLPDRDALTLKHWLEAHPEVELVSRDRSSSYSRATTESAPQAQQVADRWHLLKNAREAIERLLERHLPIINDALKPCESDSAKRVISSDDQPLATLDSLPAAMSSVSPTTRFDYRALATSRF